MDLSDTDTYAFPLPSDEDLRLAALHSCRVLDVPSRKSLSTLMDLASRVFDVPIAFLSLIEAKKQRMLAMHGADVTEMPRSTSFCTYAILQDEILFVPDARIDERFLNNPLVVNAPYIRFYAGVPLQDAGGYKIGTFALIDHLPRAELKPNEQLMLRDFATIAAEIMLS